VFGWKKKVSSVKCGGPGDVLVWRAEGLLLTEKSTVHVADGQEAIIVCNGRRGDPLPAGLYVMGSDGEKGIALNLASGRGKKLNCDVFYINRAVPMPLEWGTDAPIKVMDPQFGVSISVRAYGDYAVRVTDSRKFSARMVGALKNFDRLDIQGHFASLISAHVSTSISEAFVNGGIGGMAIATQQLYIGGYIKDNLAALFSDYGLTVERFTVAHIQVEGLDGVSRAVGEVQERGIRAGGRAEESRLDTEAEVNRIRAIGSAENAVKLERGSVETQINRMKGITEQERMQYNVDMARAKSGKDS